MHVHVQHGEFQSKIDLIYENGKLKHIIYRTVKGYKPLPSSGEKEINKFLRKYHQQIIDKWTDFFILHRKPKFERITRKIK